MTSVRQLEASMSLRWDCSLPPSVSITPLSTPAPPSTSSQAPCASDINFTNSPVTAGGNINILTGALATSDVNIGTGSAINSTGGSVTIASGSLIDSDVIINSDVTGATFVDVTSAAFLGGSERIDIGPGVTVQGGSGNGSGNGVILNSDTVNLGTNATVATTASSILFEGGNRLNVGFGTGAQVTSVGGNIDFNTTGSPTAINITGGTSGLISSNSGTGTVGLNGGGNAVSVNINQIDGCIIGTGSSISITTNSASGDILVGTDTGGSLNSTGILTLNSGRDVIFKGGVNTAVGTVDIDAVRDVIVADTADATVSTAGNIFIDAGDGVNIGNDAVGTVLSTAGNISINAGGASGTGTNDLNIGANAGSSGSRVEATTGNVSLATTGDNSDIRVGLDGDGTLVAGGTIDITTAGIDSDIDIGDEGGKGSVTAGGNITFNSSDGVSVGDDSTGTVVSTGGDISITSNNDVLVIGDEFGSDGSFVRADNGNVSLLANGPTTDIIIGNVGNASVQASGLVFVSASGVNGDIKLGEDFGSGTITAGGDINLLANDGVKIGNTGVGTVTSTNGDVNIVATGASGTFFNDLSIGIFPSASGSSVNANNGSIFLTAGNGFVDVGLFGDASVNAQNNVFISAAQDVTLGITSVGTVTASTGTIDVFTGSGFINMADNSKFVAQGNLSFDTPGTGFLDILMGTGASLTSNTGKVSFQLPGVADEGEIIINGGTINSAICIDYNVGPNDLLVDVQELNSPLGNRVLTSSGNPTSISFTTQTGDIVFCAGLDINTANNGAAGGGPISITAVNGAVDLNGNNVTSTSSSGDGGAIDISSTDGILNGGNFSSRSTVGSGGSINLNGGTGDINVGTVFTSSNTGNAGPINIATTGNITTDNLSADSNAGNAADITVNGGGNVTTGNVRTSANGGFSANISLTAGGDLVADNLVTSSNGHRAGDITTSSGGNTTIDFIAAGSNGGDGGAVNSTAGGDLTTNQIILNSNGGNGGSFTATANNGALTTGAINVSSSNRQGGSVNTSSQSAIIGGAINANGGTNGGTVSISVQNPLSIGGAGFFSSIAGNVTANGGSGNGGTIAFFSQGSLTQFFGNTISANGGTTGGVITFNDSVGGAGTSTYNINGTVQAHVTGTIPPAGPNSGVVGFNAGPGQDMILNVGGSILAGQQVTLGNLDPATGLPNFATPSGLIVTNPFIPDPNNPNPPFFTPLVVFNGTQFIPPTPADSGSTSAFGSSFSNVNSVSNNIAELIGQFLPTDQTRIIEGSVQKSIDIGKTRVSNVLPASKTFRNSFDKQELTRLVAEGNDVEQSQSRFISINKGRIIFAPDKTIVVKVKEGQVIIPGGAVVMIDENSADSAIFDLHQTGKNGVKVVSEGKMIDLHPGRMLFLSKGSKSNFEEIDHDCKLIGYQNPVHKKLSDDVTAFSMRFSIPSAIKKVQPFRKMMDSKDKNDRAVINKLLLNAVLLREHMPYKGPFMSTANINP